MRFDDMSDDQLRALVDDTPVGGWGTNQTATLASGDLVFVKRLPLTDLEHARAFSTKNHFELPAYYQYGVGSAGFGAWRELAAHQAINDSPQLLHHRVMPTAPVGPQSKVHPRSDLDLPGYVDYWNGSTAIGAFVEARQAASFELWLIIQHVPYRLFDWIGDHQIETVGFVDELLGTIASLHDRGIFHFDAHFGNVVTDGVRPMLTDFGLVTSRSFELSPDETEFLNRHQHYDFGEVIYGVGNALLHFLQNASDAKTLLVDYGVDGHRDHDEIVKAFVTNIDRISDDGRLGVTREYAAMVKRFRDVIIFMTDFFFHLRANPRKDTPFDDQRLASLLHAADVAT